MQTHEHRRAQGLASYSPGRQYSSDSPTSSVSSCYHSHPIITSHLGLHWGVKVKGGNDTGGDRWSKKKRKERNKWERERERVSMREIIENRWCWGKLWQGGDCVKPWNWNYGYVCGQSIIIITIIKHVSQTTATPMTLSRLLVSKVIMIIIRHCRHLRLTLSAYNCHHGNYTNILEYFCLDNTPTIALLSPIRLLLTPSRQL